MIIESQIDIIDVTTIRKDSLVIQVRCPKVFLLLHYGNNFTLITNSCNEQVQTGPPELIYCSFLVQIFWSYFCWIYYFLTNILLKLYLFMLWLYLFEIKPTVTNYAFINTFSVLSHKWLTMHVTMYIFHISLEEQGSFLVTQS